jgi:SAM-dependent methyltransferase
MSETTERLLLESLPLARHWAQTLCAHVDDSGVSCEPFHEIWQILRFLGLNTTATEHRDFYVEAMAPAIRAGAQRVLITGSADYAMLEVVLTAFAAAGARPEITVMDVCETPLRICQWYADRMGVSIRTRCSDVLGYADETSYDLVCTHSFLGLFDPAHRQQLASRWYALLAPGGKVLSVNRVRPGAPGRVGFTADQAGDFVEQVCRLMERSALASSFDLRELADLANRYIRHRVVYPVRDEEEISELLSAAGFHVDYMHTELLDAGRSAAPAGPTLRGGARYACFVAGRPG